jgi:hypothetical protein
VLLVVCVGLGAVVDVGCSTVVDVVVGGEVVFLLANGGRCAPAAIPKYAITTITAAAIRSFVCAGGPPGDFGGAVDPAW